MQDPQVIFTATLFLLIIIIIIIIITTIIIIIIIIIFITNFFCAHAKVLAYQFTHAGTHAETSRKGNNQLQRINYGIQFDVFLPV